MMDSRNRQISTDDFQESSQSQKSEECCSVASFSGNSALGSTTSPQSDAEDSQSDCNFQEIEFEELNILGVGIILLKRWLRISLHAAHKFR